MTIFFFAFSTRGRRREHCVSCLSGARALPFSTFEHTVSSTLNGGWTSPRAYPLRGHCIPSLTRPEIYMEIYSEALDRALATFSESQTEDE